MPLRQWMEWMHVIILFSFKVYSYDLKKKYANAMQFYDEKSLSHSCLSSASSMIKIIKNQSKNSNNDKIMQYLKYHW